MIGLGTGFCTQPNTGLLDHLHLLYDGFQLSLQGSYPRTYFRTLNRYFRQCFCCDFIQRHRFFFADEGSGKNSRKIFKRNNSTLIITLTIHTSMLAILLLVFSLITTLSYSFISGTCKTLPYTTSRIA